MFIHFLNDQILRLHGLPSKYPLDELGRIVERALLAAVIISDHPVIVPTVDIVQSPVIQHVLPTLTVLANNRHVDFVGSTTNVDELVDRKKAHFHGTRYHREWGSADPYKLLTPLAGALSIRHGDTTYDMLTLWTTDVEGLTRRSRNHQHYPASFGSRQLEQAQHLMSQQVRRTSYLDAAHNLPDKLGDHAFLWNVVQKVTAFKYDSKGPPQRSFERALAYYWILSYIQEYDRPIIARDEFLGMIDCGLRYDHGNATFDMDGFRLFLRKLGLERLILANVEEVCSYKRDPRALIALSSVLLPWFKAVTTPGTKQNGALQRLRIVAPLITEITQSARSWDTARGQILHTLLDTSEYHISKSRASRGQTSKGSPKVAAGTVFIGHGKSAAWLELRDLLRDRLGLNWEEFNRVPVAGKTVVQRLTDMLDAADLALIVLTAEDEQVDGHVRARQNVVHELGLFQGRLGFDRAIALIEDGCDEFGNLAGIVQIKFPRGNIMAASEEIRRVIEDRIPDSTTKRYNDVND